VTLALLIQHTMLMHRAMLSSVACLALTYFSALSHKRYDFRGGGGGGVKKKIFFLFFSKNFYKTFFFFKKKKKLNNK